MSSFTNPEATELLEGDVSVGRLEHLNSQSTEASPNTSAILAVGSMDLNLDAPSVDNVELTDPATPAFTTAISSHERESFMHISGEDRNKNSNRPQRPYSTTSSVYAEHTMSNPDNDQVIYW